MEWGRKLFVLMEDKAGPACLAVLILVLAVQVIGRSLGFGARLTWTDEAARILFIWSVFLSVPLAAKQRAMVAIKISEKLWPPAWRPYMGRVADLLWNLTALFAAVISLINIYGHRHYPQLTPILGLNNNHLHLVIPLAFIMVFVRGIIGLKAKPNHKGV